MRLIIKVLNGKDCVMEVRLVVENWDRWNVNSGI